MIEVVRPGVVVWTEHYGVWSSWTVLQVALDRPTALCASSALPDAPLWWPLSMLHASPGVRGSDPVTSHDAARISRGRVAGDRVLVLTLLRAHPAGLTDFELAQLAPPDERGRPREQSSLGKRRGELVHQGLVTSAGPRVKRPSRTGTPAQVWVITRAGRAALDGAAPSIEQLEGVS